MNAAGGASNTTMGSTVDRDSIKLAFDEHYGFICRVAAGIVYDLATAEDVAQETFVSLFRNPPGDPVNLRGWLTTVAVNISLNHLRKDKARLRRELGAAGMDSTAPQDAPPDAIARAESDALTRRALQALGDRERAVLVMKSSGMNYREIARAVNVKKTSVGTIIARAKSAFKAAYAGLGGGDDSVL